MQLFEGKVAAVTGAGSGIGRQLALQLAQAGAHLALADINEADLEETHSQIKSTLAGSQAAGANVSLHRVDVAERQQVSDYVAAVIEHHRQVNVLINNAGVALAADTLDASYDDMHWLMNINYWGVVHGCKEFLPHLIASGSEQSPSHILNVSSVFGLMAIPSQGAYNSSKFAVRGFTEALRLELDEQPVNVSAAFPAGIKTNIVRNSRSNVEDAEREERQKATEKLFNNTAERAATDILNGMVANEPRIMVGQGARRIDWFTRLAPKWVSARVLKAARTLEASI